MTHSSEALRCANAIRALAMDAVEAAKSGHPGMPMGMADIAEVLWRRVLRHHPKNPHWKNRDRFVLSNGHGSMLLYALLHLTGYDLPIEELKSFRQLHSKTPGHPEHGLTPGVETTTGPLGQGLANAVGMALSEKMLAARFNQDGFSIVDHYTYAFCGDGCLMEGISHEVCSLAGTWGLSKLIVIYDDNGISIDGPVKGWFTEDIPKRFESYGWNVIPTVDGHDAKSIEQAIIQAKAESDRPTLICCQTRIGFGSPHKEGTADVHGAPLGQDEIALAKKALGWEYGPFEIPESLYSLWNANEKGASFESSWNELWKAYEKAHPDLASSLMHFWNQDAPPSWDQKLLEIAREWSQSPQVMATRKASQKALNALVPHFPYLLGGSADLTGSNNTDWSQAKAFSRQNPRGDYLHYGVREFGMAGIMNGIVLHGGFLPFGGTFLVFSDYARNAIRMSALMKQPVIYVMTHDSIGLGEDGPTHQPVEHLASLRLIPNLDVWRPAGPIETLVAWSHAITRKSGPSLLALSRQNLPFDGLFNLEDQVTHIQKGAYIFREVPKPACVLVASGSELGLAMDAALALESEGISVRVVSAPCITRLRDQPIEYQRHVLPPNIPALAVEAALCGGYRMFPSVKETVGLHSFGESAPREALYEYFGLTEFTLIEKVKTLLHAKKGDAS